MMILGDGMFIDERFMLPRGLGALDAQPRFVTCYLLATRRMPSII